MKFCEILDFWVNFPGAFRTVLGLPGPRGGRKRILHEKWLRNGSPGHGFGSRPLNWLSFFAENPFLATPGPGEAKKNPKLARTISKNIKFFKLNPSLVQLHSGALEAHLLMPSYVHAGKDKHGHETGPRGRPLTFGGLAGDGLVALIVLNLFLRGARIWAPAKN